MTDKFTIFETVMCCSSGVCGPNQDLALVGFQDTVEKINQSGFEIERYGITQSPRKFRENPEVIKLVQKHQLKALPIITYNGKIVMFGKYPTLDELKNFIHAEVQPEVTSTQKAILNEGCCPASADESIADEGCCSGQNYCDISCGPNYRSSTGNDLPGKCC